MSSKKKARRETQETSSATRAPKRMRTSKEEAEEESSAVEKPEEEESEVVHSGGAELSEVTEEEGNAEETVSEAKAREKEKPKPSSAQQAKEKESPAADSKSPGPVSASPQTPAISSSAASASSSAASASASSSSGYVDRELSDADLIDAAEGVERAVKEQEKSLDENMSKLVDAEKVYKGENGDPYYYTNFIDEKTGDIMIGWKVISWVNDKGTRVSGTHMVDRRPGKRFDQKIKIRTPFMLIGHASEAWHFGNWDAFSKRKGKSENVKCYDIAKAKLSFQQTISAWNPFRRTPDGNDPVAEHYKKFICKLFRMYISWAKTVRPRAMKLWEDYKSNDVIVGGVTHKLSQALKRQPTDKEILQGMEDEWYNSLVKKFFGSKKTANSKEPTEEKGTFCMVTDYAFTSFTSSTHRIKSEKEIKIRTDRNFNAKDRRLQQIVGMLIHPRKLGGGNSTMSPLYPNNKPLRDGSRMCQATQNHEIIPWQDRDCVGGGSVMSILWSWKDDIEDDSSKNVYGLMIYEDATVVMNGVKEVEQTASKVVEGAIPFVPMLPPPPPMDPKRIQDEEKELLALFSVEGRVQAADKANKTKESSGGSQHSEGRLLK